LVTPRGKGARPAQRAGGERSSSKGHRSARDLGARPAKRAGGERSSRIEVEFFRFLNRWLEPQIRGGLGAPRLAPGGLIVLETRGRNSGRRMRVPLVATRLQGHVLIATFRGGRSQWAKNLEAAPETRFWMGGKLRAAEAYVLHANRRPRPLPKLPPLLRLVAVFLAPYTRAGWFFAILAPRRAPKKNGARARSRGRRSSKARKA
jgi:deazaflavin-dependent oxidoreductase (nitroreductase family)